MIASPASLALMYISAVGWLGVLTLWLHSLSFPWSSSFLHSAWLIGEVERELKEQLLAFSSSAYSSANWVHAVWNSYSAQNPSTPPQRATELTASQEQPLGHQGIHHNVKATYSVRARDKVIWLSSFQQHSRDITLSTVVLHIYKPNTQQSTIT